MKSYDHKKIEKKWQKEWDAKKLYKSKDGGKKKMYVLDMFPYPSGEGLHVGHPKGYIATDIVSRHARMQGKSVLHPMGWDAFGLPAENYAIKNKVHPRKAVDTNVARYKQQLKMIGLDYDWSREINTTDPEFYKWTQWIFLKLYEKGLAYQSFEPINWCPSCQTGLANEDLEGNACERCGTVVEKRPMRQWVLKITDYAERLLQDLELLPHWQESIKQSQRNWIGKSEGAEIDFYLDFGDEEINARTDPRGKRAHIKVFTTRADTLFGATFLTLSPEHPWVQLAIRDDHKGVLTNQDEVRKYVARASQKTDIERQENKEKTGAKLDGVMAINPATGEKIPLYVADYVLSGYGTGAIMAVPAHDERDFEFARAFELPIRSVVSERKMTHSGALLEVKGKPGTYIFQQRDDNATRIPGKIGFFGGSMETGESLQECLIRELKEETELTIRAEDISETFMTPSENEAYGVYAARIKNIDPADIVVHEGKGIVVMTAEEALTHDKVTVAVKDILRRYFSKTPEPYTGLGILQDSGEFDGLDAISARSSITEKYGTKKTTYKIRDWVFSRQRYWGEPIPIIHCEKCGVVPVPEKDLPVKLPDVKQYEPTGTGESPLAAIEKWVNVKCPKCKGKAKRETNTMPQWAGSSWYWLRYMDPKNKKALVDKKKEKQWAPVNLYVGGAEHATRHLIYGRFWHKFLKDIKVVSTPEPFTRLISVGLIQAEDGRKMSKRYGNVINPDDIVATYGADTLRVYEMFMGPFSDAIAWKTASLIGARRFIERVWRLQEKIVAKPEESVEREMHKTIKKVGEDIENFKFNTAISQMMIFVNAAEQKGVTKKQYQSFVSLLAPFAPHVAEELWRELGNKKSVHVSPWPKFNAKKLVADEVTIVVQINGKVRAQIVVPSDSEESTVRPLAEEAATKWLEGQTVRKVIFVANRLVNFVV